MIYLDVCVLTIPVAVPRGLSLQSRSSNLVGPNGRLHVVNDSVYFLLLALCLLFFICGLSPDFRIFSI